MNASLLLRNFFICPDQNHLAKYLYMCNLKSRNKSCFIILRHPCLLLYINLKTLELKEEIWSLWPWKIHWSLPFSPYTIYNYIMQISQFIYVTGILMYPGIHCNQVQSLNYPRSLNNYEALVKFANFVAIIIMQSRFWVKGIIILSDQLIQSNATAISSKAVPILHQIYVSPSWLAPISRNADAKPERSSYNFA